MRQATSLLFLCTTLSWAAVTGSITGTVKDQSDAVIPGVTVAAVNTAHGIETKTVTDTKGNYSFPKLPVGRYDIKSDAQGFKPQSRPGLAVDIDSALQIDMTLVVAERIEEV